MAGSLFDIDAAATVANPRTTIPNALGIARAANGDVFVVTEPTLDYSQSPPVVATPSTLYSLNVSDGMTSTGIPLTIDNMGTPVNIDFTEGDIAFDPTTGELYLFSSPAASSNTSVAGLFRIDTGTGEVTLVSSSPTGIDPSAIAFDPSGVLYVRDGMNPGTLYEVDKTTGMILQSTTLLGQGVPAHKRSGMIWDLNTNQLITALDSMPPLLMRIDPNTGATSSLGNIAPANFVTGLTETCP